eukprot:GGOE01046910.1.p3 GENE.GGOE01046910.1~~GGOE01046910.1.p3  ORF type:complete len:103 (-),score=4.35 GGOE01046910.1:672-959(-)
MASFFPPPSPKPLCTVNILATLNTLLSDRKLMWLQISPDLLFPTVHLCCLSHGRGAHFCIARSMLFDRLQPLCVLAFFSMSSPPNGCETASTKPC